MAEGSKRRRMVAWVGFAALAGLLAGVGAVYVSGRVTGNGPGGECAAAVDLAGELKPLIKGEVAAFLPAERPISLAALSFETPEGEARTIGSFAGKTLFVNLWATWCAPCRAEMPAIDRLAATLPPDEAEVIAVNLDTGDYAKAEAFLEEIGVGNLGQWRDARMRIFNALKSEGLAFGLPTTLLIDGKGCEIGVMHGPAEWDAPEAEALVRAAIAGTGGG